MGYDGGFTKIRMKINSQKELNKYENNLNKEITFEYLMLNVNNCPLNACEWCNHNCNECDLKK